METQKIIKQKIKSLVGTHPFVHGFVIAVGKDRFAFSFISKKYRANPSDKLLLTFKNQDILNEYSNTFNKELSEKIALGRAMKSKKPLTLELFVEKNKTKLSNEYIEFCNTQLINKMFENGGHKTIRSVMQEYFTEQYPKTLNPHVLHNRMTYAEIIYPYLVVMKNRMERYYK